MANNTHYSSGGDFRVDVNISDFTEEITEGIKEAIQRVLIRIGLECEAYAMMPCRKAPPGPPNKKTSLGRTEKWYKPRGID